MEKEGDQIILDIHSKLGPYYSVFVSSFHTGKLTIPNWKIPSLDAFIKTLTNRHDKLVQMGIIRSSKYQSLFASDPKDPKGKGKNNQKSKFKAPKPKEKIHQQEEYLG